MALNTGRSQGFTPLYEAAANNRVDLITALIEAKADVDQQSSNGARPIQIAMEKMNVAALVALLKAGANDNLYRAKSSILVPSNLYPSVDKEYTGSPLYWAAAYGNIAMMRSLIDEQGAAKDINTQDKWGRTPLHMAAYMGYADAIPILASAGACVNTPDHNGVTPVFVAAQTGDEAVIIALKAAGATTIDTPNKNGITPVLIASGKGHANVITVLKNLGATTFDTPNAHGTTPILYAALSSHAKAITALKDAGATTINTPNKNGLTPLIAALQKMGLATDLDGKLIFTNTVKPKVIQALLEAKADPNYGTQRGLPKGTALEIAKQITGPKAAEVVKLLEEHIKNYSPQKTVDLEQKQKPDANPPSTYLLESLLVNIKEVNRQAKDYLETLENLDKVLSLEPDNEEILSKRFIALAAGGYYNDALKDLQHLSQLQPVCPKLGLTLIEISFLLGKEYQAHLNFINEFIKRYPNDLVAIQHRVMVQKCLAQDPDDADIQKIALLESRLSPQDKKNIAATYVNLAAIEAGIEGGNYEVGFLYCEEALRLQPDNQQAIDCRKKIIAKGKNNVFAHLLNGSNKDYKKVIEDLSSVLDLPLQTLNNSDLSKVFANRGIVHCLLGNYKEALNDFDNALFLCSDDTIVLNNRALLYRIIDQHDNAERDMLIARENEEKEYTDEIKIRLSEEYLAYTTVEIKKEKPNFKAALIYCEEALRLQPDNQKAMDCRNKIIGECDEAVFYYIRSKIINGDFKDVIEDLSLMIVLSLKTLSNNARSILFSNRGFVQCLLGNYKEALDDLNNALFLCPNSALDLNNRAMVYRIMGQHDNAERDIQLARQKEEEEYTDDMKKDLSEQYLAYAAMELKKEKPNQKAALIYREEARRLQLDSNDLNEEPTEESEEVSTDYERNEPEETINVLVNLRTFFRAENDDSDKSEDYDLYNTHLKIANSNAELVYKKKQKKHVLYINDELIDDSEAAAQEISKIINSLKNSFVAPSASQVFQKSPGFFPKVKGGKPDPRAHKKDEVFGTRVPGK